MAVLSVTSHSSNSATLSDFTTFYLTLKYTLENQNQGTWIERSNIENVFEVHYACVNLDWRKKFLGWVPKIFLSHFWTFHGPSQEKILKFPRENFFLQ